jgi:hypothetical protein
MVFLIPFLKCTDLQNIITPALRFKAPKLGITPRRCPEQAIKVPNIKYI